MKKTGKYLATGMIDAVVKDSSGTKHSVFFKTRTGQKIEPGNSVVGELENACCENVYAILCDSPPRELKEMSTDIHSVSCHEGRSRFLTLTESLDTADADEPPKILSIKSVSPLNVSCRNSSYKKTGAEVKTKFCSYIVTTTDGDYEAPGEKCDYKNVADLVLVRNTCDLLIADQCDAKGRYRNPVFLETFLSAACDVNTAFVVRKKL
ncbi:MAG: hypothetical protein EOP06_24490 [Proteobacteria bacterium]|nr:MAG: hypothetical protein EOP06_24490 [Pseudomonadota bacterium]